MSAQPSHTEQPSEAKEVTAPAVSLPESQTTTALALVTQSITELNEIAAEVAALEHKYKGVVFDVKTTAGMKAACEARAAVRKPRYAIQTMKKDAKTPLNVLKKSIDDQADTVIARITAVEDPIHEQVSNEESRRENEKKAREAAEAARVEAINARIENDIRQAAFAAVNRTSAEIERLITDVIAIEIDESFAEFKSVATGAQATTLVRLRVALGQAQAMEAEQARLVAERAENERIRQENDAKAEADRARIAEEERVARVAREAEERRQTEARELAEARLGEIQAIQHQVFIATTGRLGVRKGGTRECIVETLLETEAWEVTEEKFGPILPLAREAKISAISQITEIRDRWDRRIAEAAERAEAERVETARKAAADAEAQRLADQRAQLERDQAALRAEREKQVPATTISEGADIREDSVRQARDTPCDALSPSVDEPAAESGSVAPVTEEPAEAFLMTIRLTEWLPMQSVCKAAREWAVFQDTDSKRDQKKDRKLAARAKEAEANLLAVVEQLPA